MATKESIPKIGRRLKRRHDKVIRCLKLKAKLSLQIHRIQFIQEKPSAEDYLTEQKWDQFFRAGLSHSYHIGR